MITDNFQKSSHFFVQQQEAPWWLSGIGSASGRGKECMRSFCKRAPEQTWIATKESHFLGHAVQEWAGKDKRWYFHLPYNPAAALLIERLQYLAPAVGTEGGQAVWYCRPGQKPQGWSTGVAGYAFFLCLIPPSAVICTPLHIEWCWSSNITDVITTPDTPQKQVVHREL
eukprot:bmy_13105T0